MDVNFKKEEYLIKLKEARKVKEEISLRYNNYIDKLDLNESNLENIYFELENLTKEAESLKEDVISLKNELLSLDDLKEYLEELKTKRFVEVEKKLSDMVTKQFTIWNKDTDDIEKAKSTLLAGKAAENYMEVVERINELEEVVCFLQDEVDGGVVNELNLIIEFYLQIDITVRAIIKSSLADINSKDDDTKVEEKQGTKKDKSVEEILGELDTKYASIIDDSPKDIYSSTLIEDVTLKEKGFPLSSIFNKFKK